MKKLKKLGYNKSPGPDGINSELLKELSENIAPSLAVIFQNSYNTGYRKEANISAIHEKGDKKEPENYCPVSLTIIVCKIMESIMKDSLLDFLKNNYISSDQQYRFLLGRSTTLQLLTVLDIWTDAFDNRLPVDVVYCDFMKAFDKVPHKWSLQIMEYNNLLLKVINWTKDFLINRKEPVLVNGVPSQWHTVLIGVPQGSVLGPILFALYINTLIEVLDNSELFLFADDNKLFNVIFKDEDSTVSQEIIETMFNWTRNSLLFFHIDKCFKMNVRFKSKPQCDLIYIMNNKPLEVKCKLKDLGVLI